MHSANGLKAISGCKKVSILWGYVALTYLFVEGTNAGRFQADEKLVIGLSILIAFLPQPTEWQRIGNQINAAMIFARAHFVDVRMRVQ